MTLALAVIFGWIVATCFHEFCHAAVAYAGGDKSVKDKGYLSFNPLKYSDPGLTLVIPVFMLMLGGVALPGAAVYINRAALRNKLWDSAVSAAGPLGTAIATFIFAIPFMLNMVEPGTHDPVWLALALLVEFNAVALLLNALPIAPLDGFGVIRPWLPGPLRSVMESAGRWGIWIVFGLLWYVRPLNIALWHTADEIAAFLCVPPHLHSRAYDLFSDQRFSVVAVIVGIMILSRIGKKNPAKPAAAPASVEPTP